MSRRSRNVEDTSGERTLETALRRESVYLTQEDENRVVPFENSKIEEIEDIHNIIVEKSFEQYLNSSTSPLHNFYKKYEK